MNMVRWTFLVAGFMAGIVAGGLSAAATGSAARPGAGTAKPASAKFRAQVRRALAQLTAPRWATRQKANAAIMRLPAAALPWLEKVLRSGALGPGASEHLARDIPTLKLTVVRNAHARHMIHWINRQMLPAFHLPPDESPKWDAAARTVCRLLTRVDTAWLTAAQTRRLKDAANFIWKHGHGPSAIVAYSVDRVKALEDKTPVKKLLPWAAFAASHIGPHASAFCVFATSTWYAQLLFEAHPGTPDPVGVIYQRRAASAFQKLLVQPGVPNSVIAILAKASLLINSVRPGSDAWLPSDLMAQTLRHAKKNNYYTWLINARLTLLLYREDRYNDPKRLPADYQAVARYAARSWRLAPFLTPASALMLHACAICGRPKAEFDQWFKRLTVVAPDDYNAYLEKLTYLQMNSPGSMKHAMLTFGRQCLADGNWAAHIPMILVIARERLAHFTMDMYKYYAQPSVWRDIHAAFTGFLRHYPRDMYHHSWYAMLACRCGHWNTAARQFKIIGRHGAMGIFHSRAVFHYYRRTALRHATRPLSRHPTP